MLYFSVILCKGQWFYLCTLPSTQFVLVQVYHVYFHYDMFRPDGAIFRYVYVVIQSPSFLLLSPHWPVFTHWECVVYVSFVCLFFPSILGGGGGKGKQKEHIPTKIVLSQLRYLVIFQI
jgi:hypothetical protein